MMPSHAYVTPLRAVLALTLYWSIQTTLASPLPPPHPDLEQELDSLLPQSPTRPISTKDDLNPEHPASSHNPQEFLQDVLQNEQEVTENRESSPEGNHPLLDRQDTKEPNDVSSVQNRENLPDQAPAVLDVPIQEAAGAREKDPEVKMESPSTVLIEADQKDLGEKFQNLNKKENDPENQLPSVVEDPHQQDHLQEVTSIKNTQDVQLQDSDILHERNQEEQDHDLNNNNIDSQEEELQSLQQADTIDDDDDEEETDDLEHPLPPEEQNENEAAARELDSIAPPESFHADDVYDGYDSENSDIDSDVDDVVDDDPDLWAKLAKDGIPGKMYPEEYPGGVSNIVDNHETSHFSSWWGMNNKQWPRHDLDDVMPDEGLRGVEVKRGQEEEKKGEEDEEERFRPVRVVILNETLYLNSSVDDRLPKFQPVPLPVHFEDYDVNRDGMISLPELHYVSRAREGVRQAFRAADSDDDGWVDRSEFQAAGWGRPIMNYAPLTPPSRGTMDNPPLPPPPRSG